MTSFSARDRQQLLDELASTEYDVVVIGGGITGAGILLDATSRGMKAALIEKRDFAWGTSSRSTKLIHGGLRYLKQLELGLVREVGRERAIVYRNARHIVRPEKIMLPFYENGSMGKLMGSLGLWIYDRVAGVDREERRKVLSANEAAIAEPLVSREGLTGAGLYYEYRTDDARLTIEVLKTAVEQGALALNYVKVDGFRYEGGVVSGVVCTDDLTGKSLEVNGKVIINATGPWVDEIRALDDPEVEKQLFLTSGIHIVLPWSKLPLQQSMYFESQEDERMIFCIVREGAVYCGTTDIPFHGNIDDPPTTEQDMLYLLDALNTQFDVPAITISDIQSTWSGLRPLIYQEGKSATELSRKDEVFTSKSGLLSIAGGKLTGYRKMAERIVDTVAEKLPGSLQALFTTDKIVLKWLRIFGTKRKWMRSVASS